MVFWRCYHIAGLLKYYQETKLFPAWLASVTCFNTGEGLELPLVEAWHWSLGGVGFVECGRTSLGSAGSAGSGCSCFVVTEIRGTSVLLNQQEESHSYYCFNCVSFGSVSRHFLQSPMRVCLKLPFQVPISDTMLNAPCWFLAAALASVLKHGQCSVWNVALGSCCKYGHWVCGDVRCGLRCFRSCLQLCWPHCCATAIPVLPGSAWSALLCVKGAECSELGTGAGMFGVGVMQIGKLLLDVGSAVQLCKHYM